MIDYMSKERLGVMLTTACPLKCKGCYLMIPEQKLWNADIDTVLASLPRIFKIFDRFEQVCLMGGEPFLYKDLETVMEALREYKGQFGFVRICTGAVVMPRQSIIDTFKNLDYHADIRISYYGVYSHKYDELMKLLEENNIHTTVVRYTDEEQYHGGWIEFGVNWKYRDYSPERLAELYDNCNYKTFFNWGRFIYRCPTVSGAVQLGKITIPPEDKIDLFSDDSPEMQRAKAEELVSRPLEACKYCDSFDVEGGTRFKAGEQAVYDG